MAEYIVSAINDIGVNRPDFKIRLGTGYLYTCQSIGIGTTVISGSNDSENWIDIATLTDSDSAVFEASWLFLKINVSGGKCLINRGR